MALNLFPVRVPIGRASLPGGQSLDVLMTPEFARALADLLTRIGGANGMGSDDIAAMSASDATAGQVLALRAEVAALRALVLASTPALALQRQIDAILVQMAMIEDPAAQVRYIMTRYASAISPKFQGTPTAPTAAKDTATDQVATCNFVLNQASTTTPTAPGTAAVGTSKRYARADHVHPSDTTKQNTISPVTVTGSRAGNAALTSLLSGLATQGLIINSTTA